MTVSSTASPSTANVRAGPTTLPPSPLDEHPAFNVLLYMSSNYLMTLAAFLILRQHWRNAKQRVLFMSSVSTMYMYHQLATACLVSRDMEVMLLLGTVSRVYWSADADNCSSQPREERR